MRCGVRFVRSDRCFVAEGVLRGAKEGGRVECMCTWMAIIRTGWVTWTANGLRFGGWGIRERDGSGLQDEKARSRL
jgi:hypothetical protein